MGMVVVNNLGKKYKRYRNGWARLAEWVSGGRYQGHEPRWVLRGITFKVLPGESLGIIGQNGAGKSTLLKILTGTAQASEGTVYKEGRLAALLELGIGFHADFTGRQNAMIGCHMMGLGGSEVQRLLPGIIEFSELADCIDEPVRTYSSGMHMRLAFSVATVVRPDILIVDEALSVGDIYFQQKCVERIRAFKESGTTLLFVSHDPSAVYTLCDRAILLESGRLVIDSSPKEALDLYQARLLKKTDVRPLALRITTVADQPARDREVAESAAPAAGTVGSIGKPDVTILSVQVLNSGGEAIDAIVSEEDIEIAVTVLFREAYDDPHVGFQIRNRLGEAIFQTNTYCMGRAIGRVERNERLRVSFGFKAALAPGQYTVTVGVANEGVLEAAFREQLARIHDVTAVSVLRNMEGIVWAGVYNIAPAVRIARVLDDRQDAAARDD